MNEITLFLDKTTKAEFVRWFMNEYAAIMQTFNEKPTINFDTFEFEKREVLKVRMIYSGAKNSPTAADVLKAIAQDFIVLDIPAENQRFPSKEIEIGLLSDTRIRD